MEILLRTVRIVEVIKPMDASQGSQRRGGSTFAGGFIDWVYREFFVTIL